MTRSGPIGAAALVAAAFLLSACGSSTGDRGLSGAGIGAAAGTAVGAVTGLGIIEGALIGAGAGGLTGALTDEDTINFGKPWWE
ncbi:MAG TPA: YMGG-like glycine zipper-containing protein [Kiloniellaceae bacterium]|nr:YMGG-like glycine zipper-containing protein [Kiloniellaceae bacterium]